MDTIDIEDFANSVKSSLHKYLLGVVITIPAVAAVIKVPVIGSLAKDFISFLISYVLGEAGLAAFIINTKVFTQAQAKDYLEALKKLEQAPVDIPDAEWEKLEDEANHAFRNLIRFAS
jgi:glucan phosphoethanolaminetransferase (alkaline phosphatase superfamily)